MPFNYKSKVGNKNFLLINLYNANMKSEQLSMLSDLSNMLEKVDDVVGSSWRWFQVVFWS